MSLLSSLLLLIVSARIIGEIFKRFHQPSILGEILAGIVLGPSVLNIAQPTQALSGISDLAMFFIILSAGLEMGFKEVMRSFRGKGLVIAFMSFFIPLICGLLIGVLFRFDLMRTVFLGLCISITALPVSVRILKSFNLLDHSIGRYAIVTCVVNDVLALFTLGIVLKLPNVKNLSQFMHYLEGSVIKLGLLALFILAVNFILEKADKLGWPVRWLPEKLVEWFGQDALLGMLIVFVLLFGTVSELLGSHFIIGAFFGALLIDRKLFFATRYKEIEQSLSSISSGFLAPIFFVFIGLECNFHALPGAFLVVAVIAVSIVSKIYAGWLAGRWVGLPGKEPLAIGIIVNGRGVMELVVADIALQHGFINEGLFSLLVLMGVLATFLTPILFRQMVAPHLKKTVYLEPSAN